MKKVILMTVILAVMVFTPGCFEISDSAKSTRAVSDIQTKDQMATAENFKRLAKAVPPPSLNDSQERKNLVERLERFNVANKISYIYLTSYGKVMAFYTIKGKVSSVNSMLTCTKQIVDASSRHSGGYDRYVVDSPDLDGSYGSNGDGIFFFTTEGVYVEWNGEYMLCDEPLKMDTPPQLVYDVTGK